MHDLLYTPTTFHVKTDNARGEHVHAPMHWQMYDENGSEERGRLRVSTQRSERRYVRGRAIERAIENVEKDTRIYLYVENREIQTYTSHVRALDL